MIGQRLNDDNYDDNNKETEDREHCVSYSLAKLCFQYIDDWFHRILVYSLTVGSTKMAHQHDRLSAML